jgi:hypothetical protein
MSTLSVRRVAAIQREVAAVFLEKGKAKEVVIVATADRNSVGRNGVRAWSRKRWVVVSALLIAVIVVVGLIVTYGGGGSAGGGY